MFNDNDFNGSFHSHGFYKHNWYVSILQIFCLLWRHVLLATQPYNDVMRYSQIMSSFSPDIIWHHTFFLSLPTIIPTLCCSDLLLKWLLVIPVISWHNFQSSATYLPSPHLFPTKQSCPLTTSSFSPYQTPRALFPKAPLPIFSLKNRLRLRLWQTIINTKSIFGCQLQNKSQTDTAGQKTKGEISWRIWKNPDSR